MNKFNTLLRLKTCLRFIIEIKDSDDGKKIVGLLLLKFLLAFVYCILAGIKDTVLITANYSSAEVIPIVKCSIIFPISILVIILYTKLDNHLKQSTVFYSTVIFFLFMILLYGFVLYPNEGKISPNIIADRLSVYTNGKHLHWIAIFRNWIHVLFFIIAELWGQIVLMVLYWSFVNSISRIDDAKRFYGTLIAAGDLPLIIVSQLIQIYTKKYESTHFLLTVQSLIGYIVVLCIGIIFTYWWVNCTLRKNLSETYSAVLDPEKIKLSPCESLNYIMSSKYLTHISIMVLSCGFSINLLEGIYKSYLKEVFPKPTDYQIFSSSVAFWSGIFALITSLFFTGRFLRKFGWGIAAKITPISIGITGSAFLLASYSKNSIPFLQDSVGPKLSTYIAIFGGIQNLIIRVAKYSFFDKIVQMSYIPLDPIIKIKGKTAVDILGSNLGKSGSAWIQVGLLVLFNTNSLQDISLTLLFLLIVTSIFWYRSINYVDSKITIAACP